MSSPKHTTRKPRNLLTQRQGGTACDSSKCSRLHPGKMAVTLNAMDNDERLERYLELCKRIYERMRRDGTWPWADSQESGGMVESEDNPNNL